MPQGQKRLCLIHFWVIPFSFGCRHRPISQRFCATSHKIFAKWAYGGIQKKRESPKSEWDTGVSDLGAFKLDHLQPVKLFLFQNISNFLPFMLEGPISDYSRGAKNGEKGFIPKVNVSQELLGHSNWIICSLLNWFSFKIFSTFYFSYWEVQFLITPERGIERTCHSWLELCHFLKIRNCESQFLLPPCKRNWTKRNRFLKGIDSKWWGEPTQSSLL